MVLVIGGTGYVGTRITELFVRDNIDYSILDTKEDVHLNHYYVGNILDKDSLKTAVSMADTVLYLAGAHLSNYEQNYDFLIKGLLNCLELCREYHVKRFIYASNGAVYSNIDGRKTCVEEDDVCIEEGEKTYSSLICRAERLLQNEAERENMRCVILRIGEVYGPGIYNPCSKKSVSLLGDGSSVSSKIHITDFINILYKIILDSKIEGVFNICDCCPVEQITFYQYIKEHNRDFLIKRSEYDGTNERLYWSIFGLRTLNINMSNEKICKVLKYDYVYKTYREGLNSLFSDVG